MSSPQLHLQVSSPKVYNPATVGFLLTGVTIAPLKMWHFGENVIGPIHDLVYNYYNFPPSDHPYDVFVEIVIIENGKIVPSGLFSNTVRIEVLDRKPEFDVYQTEAVIYKGNFIGLAVSSKLTGDQERYESGNYYYPWSPGLTNPWFKYQKENSDPYIGRVGISGNETLPDGTGKKFVGSQEFSVLVYSNELTGSISIFPRYPDDPGLPEGVHQTNNELTFLADVSNLPTKVIESTWYFYDEIPNKLPEKKSGLQVVQKYPKPGNYLIICQLKAEVENTLTSLTLYKTMIIRDPSQENTRPRHNRKVSRKVI